VKYIIILVSLYGSGGPDVYGPYSERDCTGIVRSINEKARANDLNIIADCLPLNPSWVAS